ncbi:MAG: haloalkane dehalogenase [Woeseiaceae bacterium]
MPRIPSNGKTLVYRTPDSRFQNLPDYAFLPRYADIEDSELGTLRMHYVDEAPETPMATVLMLHGEPSWSFLYRHMISGMVDRGYRVIAPDLIGFGRSDKPGRLSDYSYARHVDWMMQFLKELGLRNLHLFCQDWGGLVGLRAVAEAPDQFASICVSNTGLPEGSGVMPKVFRNWQRFARWSPVFPIGKIIQKASKKVLTDQEQAAYDAPFPSRHYKAGARAFPLLVPTQPDDPGAVANRAAWKVLSQFDRPVLTLFSDRDPVTRGGEKIFQTRMPGAKHQSHQTMRGGGHFLQEDVAVELVDALADFVSTTLS